MNDNLNEKLKILKNGYLNKLRDSFPDFKALLNDEPPKIEEIYSKVHTISGTSGMYGIKDLSATSTDFEFYLKPLKEKPEDINIQEFKEKFSKYLDFIEATIYTGEQHD